MKNLVWISLALFAVAATTATCSYRPISPDVWPSRPEISQLVREAPKPAVAAKPQPRPSTARQVATPEEFKHMPSSGPVKSDRLPPAQLPTQSGPLVAISADKVTLPPLDLPSAPAAVYGGFWNKQTYALLFLLAVCGVGLAVDQIRRRSKR